MEQRPFHEIYSPIISRIGGSRSSVIFFGFLTSLAFFQNRFFEFLLTCIGTRYLHDISLQLYPIVGCVGALEEFLFLVQGIDRKDNSKGNSTDVCMYV